ncbi:GH3 auxin-responsive promoter [Corchorus olitorius]|uniref:GH3 auxin-responsive promoter n=1 Tax=Corchorus olitorius TaxID=93759 RepID=A0A1R3K1T7_9ROSI|nr:GH3 auxin-responsive promoter [Corchorus olitorius]
MAYFEFLPMKKDSEEDQFNGKCHRESIEMKSNNEDIEPVDLVDVKLGQCYELLVTTFTGLYRYRVGDVLMVSGFHNKTPQFKFVERQNVILSIDADKTSESDLLKAVIEAKTLLDPLGLILTGYTSYGDTTSTPGHYVIFWELKAKEGNMDIKELDPKIMVECCYRMEESLNYTYKAYRKENAIAALEIRVVQQGSFDALMDYHVSQGATMSQYKTPSCIKSKEALEILDSRVIGKFFSPKTPLCD